MKQRTVYIVGAVAVGAALLFWLRRGLSDAAGEKTSGVTSTATGGQSQTRLIKTTPITADPAFVAQPSALAALMTQGGRILQRVRSLIPSVPSSAKLTPYTNAQSAAAAFNSPIRPQDKPSSYATIQ